MGTSEQIYPIWKKYPESTTRMTKASAVKKFTVSDGYQSQQRHWTNSNDLAIKKHWREDNARQFSPSL